MVQKVLTVNTLNCIYEQLLDSLRNIRPSSNPLEIPRCNETRPPHAGEADVNEVN